MTAADTPVRGSKLRSITAVVAGFVVIAVLSLGTDQLFHSLGVYPPWGQPMHETGLNLLALSYRLVYGILGGYVAARLAPRAPVGHAVALGVIGLVLGGIGAIAAQEMGPLWFPVLVALTALPCAWVGGMIYRASRPDLLRDSA